MCGIFGLIQLEKPKHFSKQAVGKALRDMMIVNTLRGEDSTGIATIPMNIKENVETFKSIGAGFDLRDHKFFKNVIKDYDKYKYLMIHNRAATVGKVCVANAHPFVHEKDGRSITFVHNGSLNNKYSLDNHSQYDTDSETVCHNFLHNGVEKTLKTVRGSFCFVWHDSKDDSLNFVRNAERPMAFAVTKDKSLIFYGSEVGMLKYVLDRRGIGIDEFLSLPTKCWFKFYGKDIKDVEKIDVEFAPPLGNYNSYDSWPTYGHNESTYTPKKETNTSTKKRSKTKKAYESEAERFFRKYRHKEIEFLVTGVSSTTLTNGRVNTRLEGLTVEECLPVKHWGALTDVSEGDYCVAKAVGYTMDREGEEASVVVTGVKKVPAEDLFTVPGPNGRKITKREYVQLTKDGCISCGEGISLADAETVVWSNENKPICQFCVVDYDGDVCGMVQ